jgi:two-component system sensor histidine kinase CpxA
MRSTFLKLFLAFWTIEALIFVSTLLILVNQFRTTEAVYTSAFAQMESNARLSIRAYETGGCAALKAVPSIFPIDTPAPGDQPALLFDPQNHLLCQNISAAPYAQRVAQVRRYGYMVHGQNSQSYMQGVLADNERGQHYVYILRGSYPRQIYIPYREMLPRLLISLVVSLIVTFVITLMMTRPIGLLRAAARELAQGNLRARVEWPRRSSGVRRGSRAEKDELRGLVLDFNEMAERLEQLVDAQKLLLRDVSHELRSPLARLSVALELAREEADVAAAKRDSGESDRACALLRDQLDRIGRETERLNDLIGQLLGLSSLESTRKLAQTEQVSLREVVRELLPDMEYEAQRRGCRVAFDEAQSATAGSTVLGSRMLLARAVENVIRNAIAYTSEGSTVTVSLRTEERLIGDVAVVVVKDCGPGVPEDQLQAIFRPFHRLDLARQRSTGGYGVGLAITERAIRLHGGEVKASNAAGGGLTVEIRLPVAA